MIKTVSETSQVNYHKTLNAALNYADKNKTVYRISFTANGELIRLVRSAGWVLETVYTPEKEN